MPDRLVRHRDATGRQHLLDHAQAQRKPKIQPYRVADNLSRVAVADDGGAIRRRRSCPNCAQFFKEGKGAINCPRLSCRSFAANAVRLQLRALAYNLGNFMRTLAMPQTAEPWSLTSLREKLIKIGAKVVSHGRYTTFQKAEVAVPRQMFQEILMLIARLRARPAPA